MTTVTPVPAYELAAYIREFYGDSIPAFAAAQGTTRQHIHQLITRGAVVVGGKLYSYRRDLAAPGEATA